MTGDRSDARRKPRKKNPQHPTNDDNPDDDATRSSEQLMLGASRRATAGREGQAARARRAAVMYPLPRTLTPRSMDAMPAATINVRARQQASEARHRHTHGRSRCRPVERRAAQPERNPAMQRQSVGGFASSNAPKGFGQIVAALPGNAARSPRSRGTKLSNPPPLIVRGSRRRGQACVSVNALDVHSHVPGHVISRTFGGNDAT
jgi:hypothetical protein